MNSHFSRTVARQLARKGITLQGGQACPAFDGDKFFSGIAYGLVKDECHYLRTYGEVLAIAKGETDLIPSPPPLWEADFEAFMGEVEKALV